MNKEAVEKVINVIKRARAERVIMHDLFDCAVTNKGNIIKNCETAGCVAGWTLIAHNVATSSPVSGGGMVTAGRILGLTPDESYNLFMLNEPVKIGRINGSRSVLALYDFDHKPAKERKKIVLRVLEKLRDTGKVQWREAIQEVESENKA